VGDRTKVWEGVWEAGGCENKNKQKGRRKKEKTRGNGTHRSENAAGGDGGEQCVRDLPGRAADADGDRGLRHGNRGA